MKHDVPVHAYTKTSHKRFSEGKQVHVGMEASTVTEGSLLKVTPTSV